MFDNPYQAQFEAKNQHRTVILSELRKSDQRFTDLQNITGFSPRGLSNMLKGLLKDELIEQNLKNKIYSITNHGLKIFETLDISYITSRIIQDDGMYYPKYSGTFQAFIKRRSKGAIRPFLYMDKSLIPLNLFSTDDVEKIENTLYKKLGNSINRNRLIEKNTGEIVLGFVIDYHKAETLVKKPKRKKQ